MNVYGIVHFCFFLLLHTHTCSSLSSSAVFSLAASGRRLTGYVIRKYNTATALGCSLNCLAEYSCKSINFNKEEKSGSSQNCELSNETRSKNPKYFQQSNNFDYYEVIEKMTNARKVVKANATKQITTTALKPGQTTTVLAIKTTSGFVQATNIGNSAKTEMKDEPKTNEADKTTTSLIPVLTTDLVSYTTAIYATPSEKVSTILQKAHEFTRNIADEMTSAANPTSELDATMSTVLVPTKASCTDGQPLGMESGEIPDHAITASSHYSKKYMPYYARLKKVGGNCTWEPPNNQRHNSWLQVDLGQQTIVKGIATQGTCYTSTEWMTSYSISHSADGSNWTNYEESGLIKIFQANVDRSSIVIYTLGNPPQARYMRVLPKSWSYYPAMRLEYYGCRL